MMRCSSSKKTPGTCRNCSSSKAHRACSSRGLTGSSNSSKAHRACGNRSSSSSSRSSSFRNQCCYCHGPRFRLEDMNVMTKRCKCEGFDRCGDKQRGRETSGEQDGNMCAMYACCSALLLACGNSSGGGWRCSWVCFPGHSRLIPCPSWLVPREHLPLLSWLP